MMDNFTHMNLTEAQAVEICKAHLSLHDSMYKVQLGMEDTSLKRWIDALTRLENVHGSQERSNAESFDRFGDVKVIE